MKLQLFNGHFTAQDALDMLTKMTQIKVGYHERQISASDNEEDIKWREKRIKDLQRDLQEARQYIAQHQQNGVRLEADVVVAD
ncbi:hypothetical protein FAES_1786 [Fibrella aestuarina BUZ 2]|uniref:Uncharacterized protein n=1 Tax=Fibrella aestuarina BUZ 2 TaxID=1166018 RepID=I0K6P3_9BACT|nr:hypothetical protein [Fibrella aestuarina]CCG99796.1 hypothetical protein FAES_1786 [Fibrella aestuarina BUZ 2]